MNDWTKPAGLPVGERDRLCRLRAITLWQKVAELPEPYRHTTLFELVKLWVEQTPDEGLIAVAADLRGRARRAEQKRADSLVRAREVQNGSSGGNGAAQQTQQNGRSKIK